MGWEIIPLHAWIDQLFIVSSVVCLLCAGHCTEVPSATLWRSVAKTVEGMSRMILWNGGALLAQTLVDAPSMALFQN